MDIVRHGFSVGIERSSNHYYLYIKAIGKLTHEDYKVIVPMIENALEGISDPDIVATQNSRAGSYVPLGMILN